MTIAKTPFDIVQASKTYKSAHGAGSDSDAILAFVLKFL